MTSDRLGRLPTVALALVVPLVALVTVVVTLNVTDDGVGAASDAKAAPGRTGTTISIRDFQYAPDPIEVEAGATVRVTNDDGTVHTLTAVDKSFDTGDLEGGASATITLAVRGTYKYFCDIHNYMTGTIEVR